MHNSDVEDTGDTVDGHTCNDSESTAQYPSVVTADSSGIEPTSEPTDCQNTERHCELERESDVDAYLAKPKDSCQNLNWNQRLKLKPNLAPNLD